MTKEIHRKNRRSFNIPGHGHYLTFSCQNGYPLLSQDRTRRWFVNSMESVRKTHNVELWAYVVMPTHAHVVVRPREDGYEMRRILSAIKYPVSKAARDYLEESGNQTWLDRLTVTYPSREVFRFWLAGGGYDHNLAEPETVHKVIDYVHANPVRSGLVEAPLDWEWSSARFWSGCTDVPIKMDTPCF